MRTLSQIANRRSSKARLMSATSFALEAMESRVMLSTTFTTWTFDQLTVTTTPNLSPAPSTGSGTALTVGMQTSSSNTYSPGGTYAYPNANASGTGDISDILNGTGNNPSGNELDHSSTGNNTAGNSTNPAWRVRGSSDGWSGSAALASQGAQFMTSTSGYSGVTVSFDLDASSGSAPSEIAVEYTTDGSTWTLVPAADLGTPTSATGNTTDVTVATNSSNSNIVNGAYYQIANSSTTPDALYWQNGFTINLTGISAVNGNANFGIRIVNAATGSAEYEVGGTAFPAAGAGNWRLDNVDFTANGGTLTAPAVTTQPGNTTVPAGNVATFTAAASGNPTPTVQWQVSTNGGSAWGNDTVDAGNTTGTLTINTSNTAADNGNEYRAVFTNSQGNATSNAATLTDTLTVPAITTQPTSITTTAGGTVTFSAAASGSPVPTVQWQSSTNGGSTWGNISGATSTTYSFTSSSSQNNYEYRAVFTNSSGTATSNAATLLLGGSLITGWNFGSLTAGQTILNPAPSTGTGTASSLGMGSVGTYSVYPGDPAAAFTLTVHDSSGNYTTSSIATGTSAASIQSTLRALHSATTGSITVTTSPTASAAAGVLLTGDTGATLTGNGTGTGFFVTLDAQATASGLSASQVTGSPDDSNIIASADLTGLPNTDSSNVNAWRIVGTNGWNSAAPIGTQGAQFLTSTSGYTSIEASFDLYATAQGEGRIQVEYTTDGSTWNNVPAVDLSIGSGDTGIAVGNNSSSGNTTTGGYFNITAASANSWYNSLGVNLTGIGGVNNNANFGIRIVNASTGADCVNITGAALNNSSGNDRLGDIQITASNPVAPIITTNPTSQSVAAGNTATFTTAALGYPTPTVQWKVSTNGGTTWTNDTTDAGNTTSTLQVVASTANSGYEYEAVYSNSVGNTTTTPATLSVGPAITTQPISQTVNAGTTVTLTAAATGNPTPTLQWQISTNGGSTWGNISGATSGNYTFTATEGLTGDQYHVVFTNSAGSATTTAATLTVIGTPIAQWAFTSGEGTTAGGSTAPGTGNDPYPTFGPLTNTAGTLGLANDYTGAIAMPESDIIPLRSTVNNTFVEFVWRLRSGSGGGATGTPGTPEGWSQDAPEYAQGVQFDVNTTGYSDITLHFDWNQGGISDMQPIYSLDGGTTWINLPGGLIEQAAPASDYYGITSTAAPTGITVNLQGISGANNNSNFELRLAAAYNPTLPLIDDGNELDPTLHGQYATGVASPVSAQQVITLDSSVTGGNFTLTYGNVTTSAIAYDGNATNEIADITAALTPVLGAGNFSVAQTNSVAAGWNPAGGPTAPNRDIVGNPFTVTFQGSLGNVSVPTMTANGTNLTGGSVSVATWVNGSANGFKPYVDGGGAWELGNLSFNGDSSNSSGLSVTAEPAATSVAGGGVATFTSTAYCEATPTVVWQVSTDGGNTWNTATGTTSPTTFTSSTTNTYTSTFTYTSHTSLSDNGYEFRAVFTSGSSSAASAPATLTVLTPAAPVVTTQPTNVSVLAGDVATLSAVATGAPTPTVQWQISSNGGTTWTNISGATASSVSITTLSDASQSGDLIRAQFANAVATVNSTAVTLTVLLAETDVTNWNFGSSQYTTTLQAYDNSPAPSGGVVDIGTLTALGMTLPYNKADAATGTDGNGSVTDCDITSSSTASGLFTENTWRIRGGVPSSTPGGIPAGGTPANGWSNFVAPGTQGAQISVPTTGYSGIYVTFDWYCTHSGELDAQEQYTIDGTDWINIGNPIENLAVTPAANDDFYGDAGTSAAPQPVVIDLTGISGVANNPNFGVRFVNAYNPTLSNTQTLTLGDTSNFTLSFNGQTTATINYSGNATTMAANIQAALGNLSNVGSANVTVTSTSSTVYSITFDNALNVVAQPAIVPTDSADYIGYNPEYANAQMVGNPLAPVIYNGGKGNWRFDNFEVHGNVMAPSWVSVSTGGNFTWNSGNATLTINSGNYTISADPGAGSAPTIVDNSASSIITINTGGNSSLVHIASISGNGSTSVASGSNVDIAGNFSQATLANSGAVEIDGTGTVGQLTGNGTLTVGSGSSNNTVQLTAATTPDSVTDTQTGVTVSVGSTLDITNNILQLNYGSGSSPLAGVQTAVQNGYDSQYGVSGATGTYGTISSSTANAGSRDKYAVGYADSTELSSIPSGNVEVMFTLSGDDNLDELVNFNDFSILQNNYDQSGRDWSQGDYNHDGSVNFNDFSILQNNYDQSLTGASSIFSSTAISSAAPKAAAAPVASSDAAPVYATYTPATENLFSSGADSILA